MRTKPLCGLVVLAGIAANAAAQSDANFDSTNNFTVSVSDPSVTITQDPLNASGPYQNFTPQTSGDGVNVTPTTSESFDFATGGYVYAQAESYSLANGMATQFQGENYNIVFDNTSATTQTFTLNLSVVQDLYATGTSQVDAYAGWEFNGYQTSDYFTNTLYGNGTTSATYQGFTGGYNAVDGAWEGSDSVTYTMNAGQSVQVQIWASGDTYAASPAPEPATLAFLGLSALGAVVRRRRRA